jgi:glutathione S-transferase
MNAKMKLYSSKTSPYARKVWVVAHELGLADRIEDVPTDPFKPQAEFLAANPLSKIPALVTETGLCLLDSALIVEYLQTRERGFAPLPRGARRWHLLRSQQLGEGILSAAVASRLELRRPPEFVYQPWLDRQAAAIQRALDALEGEAAGFLHTGAVRVAEITIAVALGYLDFRLPQIDWRHNRERLWHWYQAFAQRPSMQRTQPVG